MIKATVRRRAETVALSRAVPAKVEREASRAMDSFVRKEVPRIRARGFAAGGLAARVAGSVQATRGGIVGGAGTVSTSSGIHPAADLFYGAEFGGGGRPATQQFRPYRARGYFFFAQLADDSEQRMNEFHGALDAVAEDWG